jgi:ABC-type Na+ efflux pump permease subunit
MIDSQPEVPSEPETSDRPLTVLRGAGVDVDPRRAVQLVVAVCLVALTVVAVVLLLAGTKKNSQAVSLHDHGVPVTVTVSGCLGLLGGSGSNPAGYSCKGSYTFDGHRYQQAIPGNALLHPGAVVQGVIVPGDPSLLSTPGAVADQHASWRVFILPVILFALVAVALVVLLARNRRRTPGAAGQPPGGRAVGA